MSLIVYKLWLSPTCLSLNARYYLVYIEYIVRPAFISTFGTLKTLSQYRYGLCLTPPSLCIDCLLGELLAAHLLVMMQCLLRSEYDDHVARKVGSSWSPRGPTVRRDSRASADVVCAEVWRMARGLMMNCVFRQE